MNKFKVGDRIRHKAAYNDTRIYTIIRIENWPLEGIQYQIQHIADKAHMSHIYWRDRGSLESIFELVDYGFNKDLESILGE